MILSDNETKVDLLNSEPIAQTIVNLIKERPDRPVTIGVHGDWGAGKSSVLEMIEANLEGNDEILCIKFNGWRFQGFEDAKIALIEGIVTELVEKRSLFSKAKLEVIDIFERIDWLKAAKKAGGLLLTATTGIPSPEIIETVLASIKDLGKNPAEFATKDNLEAVYEQVSSVLKPRETNKNAPKEISEFRKSFEKLLKAANVKQLVVLVDDLDRCLPDTAIETLEAIRLFMLTDKTAFIIAADEGMIEYAVRKHFPDLPDSLLSQSYTRSYLEKLIQVPFRIPILGETETRIYVTLLLVGSLLGEGDEFNKLVEVARGYLKKPWEGNLLNAEKIEEVLKENASKVQNTLLLSDQIGPILASGTKGNPRQIKRFLNSLLLRNLMAEARGFGGEINLSVLAKLMIAERFIPRLFEQIANISAIDPNGSCQELADLENEEEIKNETSKPSKEEDKGLGKTSNDSSILSEWMASSDVKEWAQIKPPLAKVDLRPYIFVTKEKKDFFARSTSLGHLSELIDKLFSSKLAIKTIEPEIKALNPEDAIRVFEEIRSRIIGSSDFTREPQGIQGITALVKSHPTLQDSLVSFLEGLPIDKLGIWAVVGWDGVIVGSPREKYNKLLSLWASNGSNKILKTAAANILKITKAK